MTSVRGLLSTDTARVAFFVCIALALPQHAATAQALGPTELMTALGSMLSAKPDAPAPNALSAVGPASPTQSLAITVYLKPGDPDGLAAFVAAVQTPGDPSFHQFLSAAQFLARFAPTEAALGAVTATLQTDGFRIDHVFANRLAVRVTDTVAAINSTFGLTLQTVANANGGTGYASTTNPTFPAGIAPYLRGVGGFQTLIPSAPGPVQSATAMTNPLFLSGVTLDPGIAQSTGVTSAPGALLPADYEKLYDLMPLVQAGATGQGQTVGIVTEQAFDPTDATKFWSTIGLTVPANHLQISYVDSTENVTVAASSETSESNLDTEQAGAIAPAATILAYVTSGGPAGLLDGFEQAASDNLADVVSSSFGTPELYFQANKTMMYTATLLPAFNDAFAEMAAQGQTVFAAAGDAGAFGANRNETGFYWVFPGGTGNPAYTPIYSVNAIAANPLVTAAGGTTLPISGTDSHASPAFAVTIASEQPWSFTDLLTSQFAQNQNLGETISLLKLAFPEAGAGGFSAIWPLPTYQQNLSGMERTKPGQVLFQLGGTPQVLATEPAGFAGRNLPDLSANADRNSGYLRVVHGQVLQHGSGTSVVAPQFAGTQALINQLLGHRVGQLNPLLYRLQASGAAPGRDITSGDNWGYAAHAGYDQTTGLGVMDAARLYTGLRSFDAVQSSAQ